MDGNVTPESVPELQTVRPRTRRKRSAVVVFFRDIFVILIAAVVISFLIKTFFVRSFYIPSASMENTLQINDRIMVNQLIPKVWDLHRGDVVVFSDPGGWLAGQAAGERTQAPLQAFIDSTLAVIGLTAPDSNDHLIKRVIGLPGDHVTCCDASGMVTVNGVPVNEPYVVKPGGEVNNASEFDVTVPEDSLFVMGDNRYNSRDSRFQTNTPLKGFVPISRVVGQAFVITWPVNRWAWLTSYPSTFADVPAATTSGQ
ncbi:MAG: signal peptidase I [Agromyces sp.]